MEIKTRNKSRAEVLADGILPCGHAAEREDDKIIIDCCFECSWRTPLRAASDALNERAASRGEAETAVIENIRSQPQANLLSGVDFDFDKLNELAIRAWLRFGREETQRDLVKEIAEEDAYPF